MMLSLLYLACTLVEVHSGESPLRTAATVHDTPSSPGARIAPHSELALKLLPTVSYNFSD